MYLSVMSIQYMSNVCLCRSCMTEIIIHIHPRNLQIISSQVLREDRNSKARGGGVFIAVRKHYDMTLLPDLETNCEILWAKVQISASKSLTLGCFYRPPDSKIGTSEEL